MADQLIVQNGLQKIQDGDVILTYGKSSVVESLLLETKKKGIDFKVIVVDSRPLFEGKRVIGCLLLICIILIHIVARQTFIATIGCSKHQMLVPSFIQCLCCPSRCDQGDYGCTCITQQWRRLLSCWHSNGCHGSK